MIMELSINEVITFENTPDGGHLPIIDPYEGCTIGCPYCFQMNDENWNKEILVKTNMPLLIKKQLKDLNKDHLFY